MIQMIVGVLGGIGAGKSTVTRLFADLGAEVIHADDIAHDVLETAVVREALRARLGEGFLGPGGTVDRKALAARVFENPEELEALESLIHPRVTERIRSRVEEIGPGKLIILDVPLLAASPLRRLCDEILFVEADLDTRLKRVEARGWAPGELEKREGRQDDLDKKRSLADRIIDNSGTLEETRRQVERLHASWTSVPAGR
jgi:dephospho-CoA kinase